MRALDPYFADGAAAAALRALAREGYRAQWARRRRLAALGGCYRGWREAALLAAERAGPEVGLAAVARALREAIRLRRVALQRRRWHKAPAPWEFADPYRAAAIVDRLWALWLRRRGEWRQAGSVGRPEAAQSWKPPML